MLKKAIFIVLIIFLIGWIIPESIVIPVKNASQRDWNKESYWHEPWGISGVHKGIDIFAAKGQPVLSATDGIVILATNIPIGGNVLAVLGPHWRIHYYAHLQDYNVHTMQLLRVGQHIGSVGDSGNAKGKPPHLHYALIRVVPNLFAMDSTTQGYKKAWYMNPDIYLTQTRD